jgi:chromosome segregation ATPase
MSNLSSALQQLRQEQKQSEQRVEKLRSAISIIEGWSDAMARELTALDPAASYRRPHAGAWQWRKN